MQPLLKQLVKHGKRSARKAKYLALKYVGGVVLSFPRLVKCNVCAWQGRHFLDSRWHPHTTCPRCVSGVRHRLLVAALSHIDVISYENIVYHKHVLHFAPEMSIKSILQEYADRYITADFLGEGVDMTLDISDMSSIKADEFGLLIACDVLEHVHDDIMAMHEIHRVLRLGGYAILTVPQKDDLEETFEDKTVVDPRDRKRIFGQSDHLRIYGSNFPKLLGRAGFKVRTISERDFTDDMARRYVLFPPVLSENPLATNYRKVFFAQKT